MGDNLQKLVDSSSLKIMDAKILDLHMKTIEEKKKILQDLDLFILDNSIRETTVGQLRGHTLENKWHIYNQVLFFILAVKCVLF